MHRRRAPPPPTPSPMNLPAEQILAIVTSITGSSGFVVSPVVAGAAKKEYLVEMPNRFKKTVWVIRGSYVLISLFPDGDSSASTPSSASEIRATPSSSGGNKLAGTIEHVYQSSEIKDLKRSGEWPAEATVLNLSTPTAVGEEKVPIDSEATGEDEGSDSENNDDDLWENPNRR